MNDQQRAVAGAVKEGLLAGLSIIWPREDGSKAPDGNWKDAQAQPRSRDRLLAGFRERDRNGLMVVCGKVSGGLEVLDFENAEVYATFQAGVSLAGHEDLLERIEAGYQERCPRGGYHLPYRCEVVGGNRKLAFDENCEVVIETRGEGGCFMAAPSRFNGSAWTLMKGGFSTIATISVEERELLHHIATMLCQAPKRAEMPVFEPRSGPAGEDRPGDDFNRRGSWGFLAEAGWTMVGELGSQQYWRRPGKDQGHSAVLHTDSGLFVPFSSSTPFPQTEMGYSKYRTYTYVVHGGDFSAASRALRKAGYGKERGAVTLATVTASGRPEADEFGGMRGDQIFDLEVPDIEHLPVLGVDGFVMKGAANLLYAFPKAGKTELTRALLQEWIIEGEPIVYLSEEPLFFWKDRFEVAGEPPDFWSPAILYPAMGWGLEKAFRCLSRHRGGVLVVDTIRNTLGYQEAKGDEDVARIVVPLITAARELDMTLLCLYHARKMPGENGTDISGHHSLYGAFDRAIQLRRVPDDPTERKRRLVVSGRLLDPMGTTQFVYTMRDDGGFQALDTNSIVGKQKQCEACGHEFLAKRSTARFCGDLCRQQAHRKHE